MSGKAIATLTPTAAVATVSFVPGEPLNAKFREIRVAGPVGPSAYDVAVAQGFTGTEAEWLATLVGASSSILLPAGVAISGHRAVMINASGELVYPSLSEATHGAQIIGLTEAATPLGAQAAVRFSGAAVEPSWGWARGPVFVGDNGVLTQVPPAGAWVRQIGVAFSATKIIVNLQPVILT